MEDVPSTQKSAANRSFRWAPILLVVVVVCLVGGAYWVKTTSTPVPVVGGASQDALMKTGLDALYTRNDPNAAAAQFHAWTGLPAPTEAMRRVIVSRLTASVP